MKPKNSPAKIAPAELARRYQRAVGADPDGAARELEFDEGALLEVVLFYRKADRLDEALAVADRALAKFPYAGRLYLAKAKVLVGMHVLEYALEVLDRAEVYAPGTPQVRLQRAEAFAALGREEDAFAELDALSDAADHDPVLKSMRSLAEATIFEQMGRHADQYFFVEQAIREWRGNSEAFERLWIATELTGRHAHTEQLCESVLAADAYNAQAWFNLGHARYAQGKTAPALLALEYAYIIDPRYDFAYREAGEICYETGRYARAIEVYETMMEYICCDNEVLLRLGQCYLHEGAHTQARLCINRVLTRDGGHDEAHYYSGLCYAAEGRWTSAVNAYRRALRTNDRNELYFAGLADALVQTGDLARAEHYYARAAETAPELGELWLNHAVFLLETDRALEALAVLDEAEEHAYDTRLEYCRVAVMIRLGREAAALRRLAELLEEDFDAHGALFEIAPALAEHDLVNSVVRCFR